MNEKKVQFQYCEYTSDNQLSNKHKQLVDAAKQAAKTAYSPYSKFSVGAAVLLDNDEIITGNNQENAAYPSGLCAERVATFYANAQYPNVAVRAIAIVASNSEGFLKYPAAPCGSCRQVLLETEERFKEPITIILHGEEKTLEIPNAKSLLPFSFDKTALD